MQQVKATVLQGHRVASGQALPGMDQRFNQDGGTIALQIPEFRKRGLDFDEYFGGKAGEIYIVGTLGCDVAPFTIAIGHPEYHFMDVRWTDKLDKEIPGFKENFFLSPAKVEFGGKSYKALLYIPDPATKLAHLQRPSTIEVIAEKVPNIRYGDSVTLFYNPEAIKLEAK